MRRPPRVLALIGPRAAGKSSIGAVLARRADWEFVDGDGEFTAAFGVTPGEALRRGDEGWFRGREAWLSRRLLAGRRRVVALGGGAVLDPGVRAALRLEDVCTVFLCAEPAVLAQRIEASPIDRPALNPSSAASVEADVAQVLANRLHIYRDLADIEQSTAPPATVELCATAIYTALGWT